MSLLALSHMQAESKAGRLGFVAGLIQTEKLIGFERLLFRATRGNMFLRKTPVGKVKDPATGELQEKHVFVVFYAGDKARAKILKVGRTTGLSVLACLCGCAFVLRFGWLLGSDCHTRAVAHMRMVLCMMYGWIAILA